MGETGHGSYPTAFLDSLAPVTEPQDEALPIHSRLNTNDWGTRKTLPASKCKMLAFHSSVLGNLCQELSMG